VTAQHLARKACADSVPVFASLMQCREDAAWAFVADQSPGFVLGHDVFSSRVRTDGAALPTGKDDSERGRPACSIRKDLSRYECTPLFAFVHMTCHGLCLQSSLHGSSYRTFGHRADILCQVPIRSIPCVRQDRLPAVPVLLRRWLGCWLATIAEREIRSTAQRGDCNGCFTDRDS
jgi:hypothetical protein